MGEILSWKERDPTECSLVSRASARVGWVLVCPHPQKLGMGRDARHNGADDSESEWTRKATLLPAGHPNLTFRKQEKECPLGRCRLGLREALCRAAFKPQDCQGQKPKPLSECQLAAS